MRSSIPANRSKASPLLYAVGTSNIGSVIVAMRNSKICAIGMGHNHTETKDWLRQLFPSRTLVSGGQGITSILADVVAYINDPAKELRLTTPLDLGGTPFQHRVWDVIRDIPKGQTMTYGNIAKLLNNPNASRAVGRACGANRLAVIVPCHRVVDSQNKSSSYRWGSDRKKYLLTKESQAMTISKTTKSPYL